MSELLHPNRPVGVADTLWLESLHFLVASDLEVVVCVSRRLHGMISKAQSGGNQHGSLACRRIERVEFLCNVQPEHFWRYAEYVGGDGVEGAVSLGPQYLRDECGCNELVIDGRHGAPAIQHWHSPQACADSATTHKRWRDAPCVVECRAQFEKKFHPLIGSPFERLDFGLNMRNYLVEFPFRALFGFSFTHHSSTTPKKHRRTYWMVCSDPPTTNDLRHVAHLLWHLQQNVAVDRLMSSLRAIEWIERNLFIPATLNTANNTTTTLYHSSISIINQPVFNVLHAELKLPFAYLYDEDNGGEASIDRNVKAEVLALLFDERLIVRVRRALTLWFYEVDDISRMNLCSAGEHFVKLFMASERDPKDLLLIASENQNDFHCHQIITNEATGSRFVLSRRRETIVLCRYDPVGFPLCNDHCEGLWRCRHRGGDRWSRATCCEDDPATAEALKPHEDFHNCSQSFCPSDDRISLFYD